MKARFILSFIVAFFYISTVTMFAQATTYYVSPTGGNTSPYANWADAATNIQDAVNAASDGDTVLVDDGTYMLSTNVSITKGITVKSLNGYSTSIIDGNNATRCFFINHVDAVLDGFTIRNGYNPSGFGGAVNVDNGGTIQNCFITGSQARDGGGVAIDDDGLVVNCIITGNSADDNSNNGYGGGVRLLNGGTVRGSLIYSNSSEVYGGGVNIWNSGTVQNCTITGNTAPQGAGIRARNNSVIENSVIYFNNGDNWQTSGSGFTFNYSCSTPALPGGTGNITDDPLFENASSDDYHLTSSSSLINAGLNDAWMAGAFDLDGNERILDGTVDIGAYEFSAPVIPISDDFYPETAPQNFWTFYDPVGDVTLNMTGTNAEFVIPAGSDHDLYTGSGNNAPRLIQPAPDTDFQIEVKFESVPSVTYQMQGIVVQEDNDTFIRFGTYYGNGAKLFVAVIDGSTLIQTPGVAAITSTPAYLRVTRTGNSWVYEYSNDGSSWNTGASFTQTFTVNQVGFYGGNAGSNPAYTASADYFMNTADPITDTDTQSPTPPTIDVWYGDTQTFGNLGNPQQWINILGRVSDNNGVSNLTYSLNSGTPVSLAIGPNGTRLAGNGDFVTEIDKADLLNGNNSIEFIATDALGAQASKTITVNYQPGNVWQLPYTADWSTISDIEDINQVVNVVDGLWELTAEGIHTVETGYDRLIVLGDETWSTNYEVTAEMTIHSASGGSGVGIAVGWQGHTGSASPRTNWPLEAIGWVRNFESSPELRILTYPGTIQAQQPVNMSADTKYLLKAKSEDIGGGNSRFSVKIWEDGTTEPASYMITSEIPDRDGSVLLLAHKADVTWGTIHVEPVSSNNSIEVTSPNGGETWTGNSTEQITWISSGVTNVNIEFSSNNGNTWNTLAASVDESIGTFSYNVPNISSTECLIRITDTDDSNVYDISDATFTIQQYIPPDPTITISSETSVSGSYVTVTVTLTAPSGFQIDYMLQSKIHFDPSKLSFLYGDYDASSLLSDYGWTGTFYSAIPGTVDIILAGSSPIDASGNLFELTFQVTDNTAGSTSLTGTASEWLVDVLETPFIINDGTVTYSNPPGTSGNRGDATLNFIVDIYDAVSVIYHWAGISTLSGQAFTNADVDFDGDVDIDDYLKIISFVYLHDWNYSFPTVSPSSSITFNNAAIDENETVSVPFELSNSSNVQSIEVEFDYDNDKLEYAGLNSSGSNCNYLRAVETGTGRLKVFGINNDQIKNENVGTIRFKRKEINGYTEVLTKYKFNNGESIEGASLKIGDNTVTSVNNDIVNEVPTEYSLSQNYPNPFNPTTTIKFAVPESGLYKLVVYNIIGQEVMTLLNKELQPGNYKVLFEGADLASGMYIYSIIGNNINISRKMLLIK